MILALIPWLSFLFTHSLGDFMQSGDFKYYLTYACDSLMDIPRKPLSTGNSTTSIQLHMTFLHGCLTDTSNPYCPRFPYFLKSTQYSPLPCPKSVLSQFLPLPSIMAVHLNSCSGPEFLKPPCFLSVTYFTSILLAFALKICHKSDHFLPAVQLPRSWSHRHFLLKLGQQSTRWTPCCLHSSLQLKPRVLQSPAQSSHISLLPWCYSLSLPGIHPVGFRQPCGLCASGVPSA